MINIIHIINTMTRLILTLLVVFSLLSCSEQETPDNGGGESPNTITQAISAANGGTVATDDGKFELVVPAGALPEDTDISIEVSEDKTEFELSPDGLQFSTPATVNISLTSEDFGQYQDSDGNAIDLTNYLIGSVSSLTSSDGSVEYPDGDQTTDLSDGSYQLSLSIDHFSTLSNGYGIIVEPIFNEEGYYIYESFDIAFRGQLITSMPLRADTITKVKKGEVEGFHEEYTILSHGTWTDITNVTTYQCYPPAGTYEYDLKLVAESADEEMREISGKVEIQCNENPNLDVIELPEGVVVLCALGIGIICPEEAEPDGSYTCENCTFKFPNAEVECDGTCGVSGGQNLDCDVGTITFDDLTTKSCEGQKCEYTEDAVLSCSPAYSVGGTVSGLDGTVVLNDGESEDLSISQNGTFNFERDFESGQSYNVTVLTQPEGQNCAVSNGSGVITDANVTDVEVVCQNSADYYIVANSDSWRGKIYHYNEANSGNGYNGWTFKTYWNNTSMTGIASAGASNIVATSRFGIFRFDGASWQTLSTPEYIEDIRFWGVVRSTLLNRFVIWGSGSYNYAATGGIWSSDNGTDWSAFGQTGSVIHAADCGDDGCMHIGDQNYHMYRSTDGINWVRPWSDGKAINLGSANDLAFGNGMWIAIDAANDIQKSTDFGDTWTDQTTGDGSTIELAAIAFGDGIFVAVGYNWSTWEAMAYSSTDGENWTGEVIAEGGDLPRAPTDVTHNDREGKFMVVGEYGGAYRSLNGFNWVDVSHPTTEDGFVAVTSIKIGF